MDNTFKVSIIVPVYNVGLYILNCLDSLIKQTYQNIEIILVDDGSTDNSGLICDEYAKKDNRILVIHKQNEGVVKARINGAEKSTGDYVTFVDSDDYVTTDYVEKLLYPVNKFNVDMVICQFYIQYKDYARLSKKPVKGLFDRIQTKKIISEQFLFNKHTGASGISIYLWAKLIKREFVIEALKAGGDLWWGEDQLAVFHMFLNINSLYISDDYLYYYVQHEGQVTQKYKREIWDNQQKLYNRFLELDKDCLLKNQLPMRTWKFSFWANLSKKMPTVIHNYTDFRNEMNSIDWTKWGHFLSRSSLGMGWKNDVKFWLVKLKQYRLLYFLFLKKKIQ